jgi:hypothetical protein
MIRKSAAKITFLAAQSIGLLSAGLFDLDLSKNGVIKVTALTAERRWRQAYALFSWRIQRCRANDGCLLNSVGLPASVRRTGIRNAQRTQGFSTGMPNFTDPHFMAMAAMVARATGLPGPAKTPELLDWQAFLTLGRQHRTLTLAHSAIRQLPAFPVEAQAEIRRMVLVAARVGMQQMGAQLEICQLFAGAGIRFLVLKGTPLSLLLFGDPVRRSSGDVDLLVAPTDFAAAARLLFGAGFQPIEGMPALTGDPVQDAGVRDLILRRGPVLLELHQRLTGNPQRLPFDFEELYVGRRMLELGGCAIPSLGPTHLGIYLFVHGASHGWQRLAWLTDIALLCRDPETAACLVRQLHALGMARAGGQAFALMRLLLGSPPPAGIRVPAQPGWLTRRLAQGYQGPTRGPAWFFQVLFLHWVGWRLRGGFGAFWQAVSYDLAVPSVPGQAPRTGWAWMVRPLNFLWRNFR